MSSCHHGSQVKQGLDSKKLLKRCIQPPKPIRAAKKQDGIGSPKVAVKKMQNGSYEPYLSSGSKIYAAKQQNINRKSEAEISEKLSDLG